MRMIEAKPAMSSVRDFLDRGNKLSADPSSVMKAVREQYALGYMQGKDGVFGSASAYKTALPDVNAGETLARALAGMKEREKQLNEEFHNKHTRLRILTDLRTFFASDGNLQRPDGSIFHRLVEAHQQGRVYEECEEKSKDETPLFSIDADLWAKIVGEVNIFSVEHDWASAFSSADFDAGDVRLPYAVCCFEFQISGRRALWLDFQDMPGIGPIAFVQCEGCFVALRSEIIARSERLTMLRAQTRAVCISLDAAIITAQVVRAPDALNAARLKRNVAPVHDYHVLSLTRRPRAATLPVDPAAPKHRRRLHWRRGHWRHFGSHKTWVRWTLVGNPDLGFVDKHYRL